MASVLLRDNLRHPKHFVDTFDCAVAKGEASVALATESSDRCMQVHCNQGLETDDKPEMSGMQGFALLSFLSLHLLSTKATCKHAATCEGVS
jgi:hypothetical protein